MRRLLLLLALAGCSEPAAPGVARADVAGIWTFAGRIDYGGGVWCADTLTMQLTQDGADVRGEAPDWHFWCGTTQSSDTLKLLATGTVAGDSIGLRWTTDSLFENCPSCLTLVMIGLVVDSLMTGRYQDHLGGVGGWEAWRQAGVVPTPLARDGVRVGYH